MMEALMQNSYAWGFLSLCTILSLVVAVYTWIFGRKTKEISLKYFTNDIINCGEYSIPQLDIKFNEKTIQDLSSTIFYIWNSGNDVINCGDIVLNGILTIKCDAEYILDAQVIKQSYESNKFHILEFNSTNIKIAFDYMDCGEGVKIQVLHSGADSNLFFDCKIKGGKPIRNCSEVKKGRGFWYDLAIEILPVIFIGFQFFIAAIVLYLLGITYNDHPLLATSIMIFLLVCFNIIFIKMKKMYNQLFHRTIPEMLKK